MYPSIIAIRLRSFAGAALCAALLAACATFQGIRPGLDTEDAIRARFGAPRMQWADADGSATLVYPFGPLGLETWMVKINPEGRVISAEQVLQMSTGFARIQMGMRGDEVTRILGPHYDQSYFSRRAETVWDYRYRDEWLQRARFHVVFNAAGVVVQTLTTREDDRRFERF